MAQFSGRWNLNQHIQAVSNQNWTGISPPNIEYLIVAGGGAGGGNTGSGPGGGGGAGGLRA